MPQTSWPDSSRDKRVTSMVRCSQPNQDRCFRHVPRFLSRSCCGRNSEPLAQDTGDLSGAFSSLLLYDFQQGACPLWTPLFSLRAKEQSDKNRCSVYSVGVRGTNTPQCWPDRRSPTAGLTKAGVERLCGGWDEGPRG